MLDTREVAALLQEYGHACVVTRRKSVSSTSLSKGGRKSVGAIEPLALVIRKGELRTIPGVGHAIADIISTLAKKGHPPFFRKLRRKTPKGLVSLLSLPGLRVRDAVRTQRSPGYRSLEALEQGARDNRIATTKGLATPSSAK